MPTYEYQCKSCSHRFEIWQKMTDEPLTVCPECQGTIRRVLFPAGIVFKGSGFYKTDHGNGAVVNENAANNANGNKENGNKENSTKTESTGENNKTTEKAASPAPASESKVSAAAD